MAFGTKEAQLLLTLLPFAIPLLVMFVRFCWITAVSAYLLFITRNLLWVSYLFLGQAHFGLSCVRLFHSSSERSFFLVALLLPVLVAYFFISAESTRSPCVCCDDGACCAQRRV